MEAMVCHTLGPPRNLELTELTGHAPGAGEVVVDVCAAGVNFPDGLVVAGTYQTRHEPPFSPGSEVAGRVRTLGDGVTELAPGDRVAAFCGIGGYAEQVTVAADHAHRIPDSLSFPEAAVFPVGYATSYHALVDRARIERGDTVLVLGASGGVGLAAVEIARACGARVLAAASSAEKLDLCRAHGADELIDYSAEDLGARLTEATGGTGVDIVYDPVGGGVADTAVRRLAWAGRYLTVGYASGDIPRAGMNRLLLKEADLLGVLWGVWATGNPERNAANMRAMFEWCAQGALRPHVSLTMPLVKAADALDVVLGRGVLGKVVLTTRNGDDS